MRRLTIHTLPLATFGLFVVAAFAIAATAPYTSVSANLRASSLDENGPRSASVLLRSQAEALRRHLLHRSGYAPQAGALASALEQRASLLGRTVTVAFRAETAVPLSVPLPAPQAMTLEHSWLTLVSDGSGARYIVDQAKIQRTLEGMLADIVRPAVHATAVLSSHDSNDALLRAMLDGQPQDGLHIDIPQAAAIIATALQTGEPEANIHVTLERGTVQIMQEGRAITLTRIATGLSNFKNSPYGRIVNIRKGLDERVDGTVVPSGTSFSFNETIGPVSQGRGWLEALAIFNGTDLRPIVGGGLCQVATTVYRAALAAGLPIDKRKNHSLYVTYYKAYGVGLDATVFPGHQDLTFTNDTPGPLLIASRTINNDGIVDIYGIDDGRTVTLEGPYFPQTAPADLIVHTKAGTVRPLKGSEIAWIQRIRHADSSETVNTIVSQYVKPYPKKLVSEFPTGDHGMEVFHSAAPVVQ
ncbi:MAG: von Willebrand factor A [Candidatus Peregrinibacteria bacterium Gr01-1014_25]|nr:MAG: von Willebrand factor A [Candidatus Peregrinibacteria bacterium Gr01-1014_25]